MKMKAKKNLQIDLKLLKRLKDNNLRISYKFANSDKKIILSEIILYEIIKDLKQHSNADYRLFINADPKISSTLKENLDRIQDIFDRFENSNYLLGKFSENLRWLELQREKANKIQNERE